MEPPSPDPPLDRGISALLRGDPRRARIELQQAAAHAPFHPVIHFDLAVAHRLLGDLPRALAHARLALELSGSARAAVLYGVHLQLGRDLQGAVAQLEAALEQEPGYRLASLYLALIHRSQGRRSDAIEGLQRALRPGPGALPLLVAERVRGQLFDLQRAVGAWAPFASGICSVAVVTEILLSDGTAQILGDPRIAATDRLLAPGAAARVRTPAQIAAQLLDAEHIVALTGAGISSASGLKTRKELWRSHDRDASVSAIGWAQSPGALWGAVGSLLGGGEPQPNAAHVVLSRLPRLQTIVTQNVDDLHQRATRDATIPILELHGTLQRVRCDHCGHHTAHPALHYVGARRLPPPCPRDCPGRLRPDVVLFGELLDPRVLARALDAVRRCDLLLIVGCSLDVAPASELPRIAAAGGARIVEIKRSPSRLSDAVGSELLLGFAEDVLLEVYAHLARHRVMPPLPVVSRIPPPPATTPLLLPPLGEGVDDVLLDRWLCAPGDVLQAGDPVAELQTDKACVELEAPFAGVVHQLSAAPDDTLQIGSVIARIVITDPPQPLIPRTTPPGDPLLVGLGPHAPQLRRGLAWLDTARWLRPGERPGALAPQLLAQIAEHQRALGSGVGPLVPWITSDPVEARARWLRERPDAGPPDPAHAAWRDALEAARVQPSGELRRGALALARARIARRMHQLHGEDSPWRVVEPCPVVIEAWLARIGAGAAGPCPHAPLVALWHLGAWPFALRGGTFGVYLPSEGALDARLPSPGAALLGLPPEWVDRSAPTR